MVDNGPCFIADEFHTFLANNRIKKLNIAPYHPQSNGLAERAVKTFKTLYAKFKLGDVQTRVCKVLYNYRATVNSITGKTPSFMLFGRNFKTALDDLKLKCNASDPISRGNRGRFQVGDSVFAKNFGRGAEWVPGTIIEVINALNYKVQLNVEPKLIWQRHASQIFERQILNADCQRNKPPTTIEYEIGSPANSDDQPIIQPDPQIEVTPHTGSSSGPENTDNASGTILGQPQAQDIHQTPRTRAGRVLRPPVRYSP